MREECCNILKGERAGLCNTLSSVTEGKRATFTYIWGKGIQFKGSQVAHVGTEKDKGVMRVNQVGATRK